MTPESEARIRNHASKIREERGTPDIQIMYGESIVNELLQEIDHLRATTISQGQ